MKRERNGEVHGQRPVRVTPRGEALVVLRGTREVLVHGCRRILCYTPSRIVLGLHRGDLEVLGSRLCCTSFSGGAVTVAGGVTGVRYLSDSEGSEH